MITLTGKVTVVPERSTVPVNVLAPAMLCVLVRSTYVPDKLGSWALGTWAVASREATPFAAPTAAAGTLEAIPAERLVKSVGRFVTWFSAMLPVIDDAFPLIWPATGDPEIVPVIEVAVPLMLMLYVPALTCDGAIAPPRSENCACAPPVTIPCVLYVILVLVPAVIDDAVALEPRSVLRFVT
jgi:hypothetical protein